MSICIVSDSKARKGVACLSKEEELVSNLIVME